MNINKTSTQKLILTICLLVLLFTTHQSCGQQQQATASDTLIVESQDTTLIKSYASRYDPRKALLYAAVLPGLGQIYNKKYWKLPLVYGGFAGLGYGLRFYQQGYKKYKVYLFENLDRGLTNDSDIHDVSGFSTGQLTVIVERYRRERDFMVILMGGMYLLQIVDAHVDAHLKEFDLNPRLQVSIEPTIEQNALIGRQTGVALILKF